MKRGQQGFTVAETLLVLILISIIGFTGYYVYHTQKSTNATYNNASQTAATTPAKVGDSGKQTYKGDGFTLQYPADWKYTAATADNPATFSPKSNSPQDFPFVYVESGPTDFSKASDDWPVNGSGRAGTVLESKSMTINGYSAYYVQTTMGGGTLYTYDIVHNGKDVNINLEKDKNDTSSLNILQQVVNSISFN